MAFDVSEVIPGGLSIQHFSHTAQHVIGVREHLRTVVGERLLSQGVHMLNTEQDLGVPGLRTRKMNDAPACLAKKYVLRRVLK